MGNTCYLNSALQCLSHVPALTNRFLDHHYDGECDITREYSQLVRTMWRKGDTPDPRPFHTAFTNRFTTFKNMWPHDSQEVILNLIEVFQKSLGADFVKDIFYGKETYEVTYPNGKFNTPTDITTLVVHPTEQGQTLFEMLKRREQYDVFSGYVDDKGTTHNAAARRTLVSEWPSTLIVTFTQYDAKYSVLITHEFSNYALFGLVVHYGSTHGGHYAAYVKHRGVWSFIDDDSVTPQEPPAQGEYYLAFYKQKLKK
jgi:hypothetical protein